MMETKLLSIKEWSQEDRPREKLLEKGIAALSDAELIAILIGSGTRNETAVELAKKILLLANNDLNQLSRLSVKELTKSTKGVGNAKAISIVAALELGRRRKRLDANQVVTITSSEHVASIFAPLLADLIQEEFWVLFLSRANKVVAKMKISIGGIHQAVVDTRIIFKYALQHAASGIVLCHNHPSGALLPSQEDKNITEKIKQGAKLFDMNVLDHIIIAGDSYYSFADHNIL